MTEFEIAHEFDAPPEAVWQLVLDAEFNAELDRRVAVERELVEEREEAGLVTRVARSRSRRRVPGWVRRLWRDLEFVEQISWRRGQRRLDIGLTPSLLAARTHFSAALTVEPRPDGGARRVLAGSIAVDVALVGRRIERGAVREMRRVEDVAAEMVRARLGT